MIGFAEVAPRLSAGSTSHPLLAGTRLWSSLSTDEREALAGVAVAVRHHSAHVPLRRAEPSDALLIVLEGWTCRYIATRRGGQIIVNLALPGDIANLDAVRVDRPDHDVWTITDATIATIARDDVLALADAHTGIARTLARLAAVETAVLGNQALSLSRRCARERVAHLLCELSVRLGGERDNANSFAFPLRQDRIGDLTGLTNVHVNRTMQQLRREEAVEVAERVLTIPDVAALRRIADFDPRYLYAEPFSAAHAA